MPGCSGRSVRPSRYERCENARRKFEQPLVRDHPISRPAGDPFNALGDPHRRLIVELLEQWWPPSHTASGADGVRVFFEARLGGRIFEQTPAGTTHEWGKITLWEPPRRLGWSGLLPHFIEACATTP